MAAASGSGWADRLRGSSTKALTDDVRPWGAGACLLEFDSVVVVMPSARLTVTDQTRPLLIREREV